MTGTWRSVRPGRAAGIGELQLTVMGEENALLMIDRADPRILVGETLMVMLRRGEGRPGVSLNGDVLTIDAMNGRVIYRLRERVPEAWAWLAEWPD